MTPKHLKLENIEVKRYVDMRRKKGFGNNTPIEELIERSVRAGIIIAHSVNRKLTLTPKIIINVQGGLVQETISTTKDLQIFIADYDSLDDGDLFTHWNCEADQILTDEEFKKKAEEMDHNFKISRQ